MTDLIKKALASPAGDDPLVYVMSDETVDRMGDVISAKGWNLTNFVKNPVALFGHKHDFVIGHWTDVKVTAGKLIGRLHLLPKGISERLDEVIAAVEAGILRAVSVGFTADPAKVERNKNGGVNFGAAELMECSLVSVPANPNALQMAKSLNLSDDTRSLIFSDGPSPAILKEVGELQGRLDAVRAASTQFPPAPEAAALGKSLPVVRLDNPVRARTTPFVIRNIRTK